MPRTITLYGSDTDSAYANYRLISTSYIEALSGITSKTVNVVDVEVTEEITGDNIEYINGELSNNNQTRRKFEVTCEKFAYSTVTSEAYADKMSLTDLLNLQSVMRKKFIWVSFYDYEDKSGTSLYTTSGTFLCPVVVVARKTGKDNKTGVRSFDFTLRHRWNNDLTLSNQT